MRRNLALVCRVFLGGLAACGGMPPEARGPTARGDESAVRSAGNEPPREAGIEPTSEVVQSRDLPEHPAGAAGFSFGQHVWKAESACTSAGFGWKRLDDRNHHCEGLPQGDGLEGSVFLQTCEGQVCLIRMSVQPADPNDASWIALYDQVERRLSEGLGEAQHHTRKLPERCRSELASCLEAEEVVMQTVWQWPSRHYVELRMAPPTRGRKIAIRVTYSMGNEGPPALMPSD